MTVDNFNKESTKSILENPGYFGAYLNMARHNVFKISNQLFKTFTELRTIEEFEAKELKDDKDICNANKNILLNIFVSNYVPSELKWNVINYLKRRQHFPVLNYFLKRFEEKKAGEEKFYQDESLLFNSVHSFFTHSFNAIVKFRNDFTHFIEVDANKDIIHKTYTIHKELSEDIKHFLNYSITDSVERHIITQQKDDFNFVQHVKLIEDQSFKLTDHGFYFFISLFLERGYAFQFLKKLTGFKNETTP